jgi:glycosyltransferase involved in cell wall biosynthesis
VKHEAWHMAVLIPARNEEALLPRCIDSVLAACFHLPAEVTFDVVVAIDSSIDQSMLIAHQKLRGYGVVVCSTAGAVGPTRALAAQAALERYNGPLDRFWLANTDADCCVPPTWLTDQLQLAAGDIEAIAGVVEVDSFSEHGPGVEERFRNTYLIRPDGSHPHIHGANLGVRADTYLHTGGWAQLSTAEDHDLWSRIVSATPAHISAGAIKVLTSGRRIGRAPRGFAGALAAHGEVAA